MADYLPQNKEEAIKKVSSYDYRAQVTSICHSLLLMRVSYEAIHLHSLSSTIPSSSFQLPLDQMKIP